MPQRLESIVLYRPGRTRTCLTTHTAVCAENLHTLFLAANDLKGSSANLGALRLTDSCDQLEQLAASQFPTGAADLIEQITREFECAESQMRSRQCSNISQTDPA